MRTRLEIWTDHAEVYWSKMQCYSPTKPEYQDLKRSYDKAVQMVLLLEACEHTDYEETLVDETIWHRVCVDCDRVTEVETKDMPF